MDAGETHSRHSHLEAPRDWICYVQRAPDQQNRHGAMTDTLDW